MWIKKGLLPALGPILNFVSVAIHAMYHSQGTMRKGRTNPFLPGFLVVKQVSCLQFEFPYATGQLHSLAKVCFHIYLFIFKQRLLKLLWAFSMPQSKCLYSLCKVSWVPPLRQANVGHGLWAQCLACSEHCCCEPGPGFPASAGIAARLQPGMEQPCQILAVYNFSMQSPSTG